VSRWFIVGLLFSAGLAAGESLPVQKGDFAWARRLELADSAPFYRFHLPLEVYAEAQRSDLGDLRVMNGKGHVVPQRLQLPGQQETVEGEMVEAKIFPLYAKRETDIESIRIQSPVDGGDERVSLATRQRITGSDQVLHGYILRLTEEEQPPAVERLRLAWRVESQGFVHRLKVEYGDDLAHWQSRRSTAVIADLRYAGERLLQQEIELRGIQSRYLRLTPVGDSTLIDLQTASVELAGERREQIANHWVVEGIEPGERAGEYLFELPGPLPVANLQILPSETNTLLRASLDSRVEPKRPWNSRATGLIYNLVVQDQPLQQTELSVPQIRDRYWRLVVDSSGGGFGSEPPKLTVGWMAHELTFAARGEAPFSLVYGSGRVGPADSRDLLFGFEQARLQEMTSLNVRLGERFELGGAGALSKRFEPDWKQWLLWTVLVLGALLLGWMAWSTLRQYSD
jgi:hypothetical protein